MTSLPVPGKVELPTAAALKAATIKSKECLDAEQEKKIIEEILKASKQGKYSVCIYEELPKSVKLKLEEKGYKVKSFSNDYYWGWTIRWG